MSQGQATLSFRMGTLMKYFRSLISVSPGDVVLISTHRFKLLRNRKTTRGQLENSRYREEDLLMKSKTDGSPYHLNSRLHSQNNCQNSLKVGPALTPIRVHDDNLNERSRKLKKGGVFVPSRRSLLRALSAALLLARITALLLNQAQLLRFGRIRRSSGSFESV